MDTFAARTDVEITNLSLNGSCVFPLPLGKRSLNSKILNSNGSLSNYYREKLYTTLGIFDIYIFCIGENYCITDIYDEGLMIGF